MKNKIKEAQGYQTKCKNKILIREVSLTVSALRSRSRSVGSIDNGQLYELLPLELVLAFRLNSNIELNIEQKTKKSVEIEN